MLEGEAHAAPRVVDGPPDADRGTSQAVSDPLPVPRVNPILRQRNGDAGAVEACVAGESAQHQSHFGATAAPAQKPAPGMMAGPRGAARKRPGMRHIRQKRISNN